MWFAQQKRGVVRSTRVESFALQKRGIVSLFQRQVWVVLQKRAANRPSKEGIGSLFKRGVWVALQKKRLVRSSKKGCESLFKIGLWVALQQRGVGRSLMFYYADITPRNPPRLLVYSFHRLFVVRLAIVIIICLSLLPTITVITECRYCPLTSSLPSCRYCPPSVSLKTRCSNRQECKTMSDIQVKLLSTAYAKK